jgi:UDP-N-acetylmuramate dehydrogenase
VKLSAGWLIEKSGTTKGLRRGHVGISSAHALALVHHGGGSTDELLSLARHVRDVVKMRFGVTLVPEPILVGTTWV